MWGPAKHHRLKPTLDDRRKCSKCNATQHMSEFIGSFGYYVANCKLCRNILKKPVDLSTTK